MNDIAYQASVQKMADHFAPKTLVTRPEVLDYQMGGGYVPTKFWTLNRVYRGVFSLNTDVDQIQEQTAVTNMTQSVSPNAAPVEEIVDTSMVSHFFTEAFIPTKDQHFVEWGNFGVVNKLINTNKFFTLFVTGDHGTGKDVMISQACALAERPMVRVQITRDTKEDHLIGTKTLVNGTIRYEEGPVVWCALNAGILVLNELDLGCPNEIMCLQNVLEGRPFFVKSLNRLITPKEGFAVIVTANTKGRGSDSGKYIGTNVLNQAFLSRFMGTLEQEYPPVKIEREIFKRHMETYGVSDESFMIRLLKLVSVVRSTYMKEAIDDHIDTRKACQILYMYSLTNDSDMALNMGISHFDDATKDAIKILWEKIDDSQDDIY